MTGSRLRVAADPIAPVHASGAGLPGRRFYAWNHPCASQQPGEVCVDPLLDDQTVRADVKHAGARKDHGLAFRGPAWSIARVGGLPIHSSVNVRSPDESFRIDSVRSGMAPDIHLHLRGDGVATLQARVVTMNSSRTPSWA